jgi:hypothetical protein
MGKRRISADELKRGKGREKGGAWVVRVIGYLHVRLEKSGMHVESGNSVGCGCGLLWWVCG